MKEIVAILGTRGSIPVSSPSFAAYGGSTTCLLLRLAGQPILIDAGTGLLNLSPFLEEGDRDLPLLLSHPHADHLLGLPMCPAAFDPRYRFHLYAGTRDGLDGRGQVEQLMHPPLWPVGVEALAPRFHFHALPDTFRLGPVTVDTMEGVHPGGVSLFRFTCQGKRVVVVTDCTLTDELLPSLTAFARNCDLLLCDGQYSPEEWPSRRSFGHSTWIAAARLAAACGAARARVIHHDPTHTDAQLDQAAGALADIHPDCTFAREGEVIAL